MKKHWNMTAKFSDLEKIPRWSINATTIETGKRFSFSQKHIGDYKLGYIKDLNYTAEDNTVCKLCETLCEHIPFNNGILKQGANNYIAADMEISYGHCSFYYVTVTNLPPFLYKVLYFIKNGKQFKN